MTRPRESITRSPFIVQVIQLKHVMFMDLLRAGFDSLVTSYETMCARLSVKRQWFGDFCYYQDQ